MMPDYYARISDIQQIAKTLRFLILAEGDAEAGFSNQFLQQFDLPQEEVAVFCFEGVSRMQRHCSTILKLAEKEEGSLDRLIGICLIADTDDNPTGRVDSAIDIARNFGFQHSGKEIREQGWAIEKNRMFCCSLSPSNEVEGRLEDLILMEIDASPVHRCLVNAIPCIQRAKGERMNSKALVQMYISAQSNSSLAGIKHCFTRGIFKASHKAYEGHANAIRRTIGR